MIWNFSISAIFNFMQDKGCILINSQGNIMIVLSNREVY